MLRGPRNVLRRLEVQRPAVVEIRLDIFFGVLANTHASRRGFLDDAVVHICKIHYLNDTIAPRFQIAPQNILENKRAKVSDMREIVDRGPAGVSAYLALNQRHKRFRAVRQCVVELDFGHFGSVTGSLLLSRTHGKGVILADTPSRGKRSVALPLANVISKTVHPPRSRGAAECLMTTTRNCETSKPKKLREAKNN